ncbi:MAG: hypothetical protein HC853_17130, partial [Anaerolineae bacterium]|nr:hypothetical protein [Anaerolineae bacterium]
EAAPQAQPTATATLPPLPTMTSPPATSVPKRGPLDTSATVGLWSDKLSETQPFTGYLDLAQGPAAFNLLQSNPTMIALNARQFHIGFTSNYTEVKANNPNWLLYDSRKNTAFSTREDEPLVNIANEDVKNQIAANVANWVTERSYDGMILDDVGVDLIRGTASPIFTGTKAFTEDQRKEAVENLLRAIRGAAPDKIILVGGYAWRDGAAFAARTEEASSLSAIMDGVHISEFARSPISKTTEFRSEANWKRDVDYLSAISQDGRIVLVTTRLLGDGLTPELTEQWLNYSVASYLLGKNGAKTYFQFDAGSLAYLSEPEMSAPLGAPSEAYSELTDGLYARKFANGIVLVNPTNDTVEGDLDADYKTLSGNAVTNKKIRMTAHTGLILLKL